MKEGIKMSQIKHYAELYYPLDYSTDMSIENLVVNDSIVKVKDIPLEERNPLLISNDDTIAGFRFYDVKEISIDGEIFRTDNINIE